MKRPASRTLLAGAALFLMAVAAYLPAIEGEFVWDDDDYIVENRAAIT